MNKFNRAYYNKILKEADSRGGDIAELNLSNLYLREFPEFLKDVNVTSRAVLGNNPLTSFKNSPKKIKDGFSCSHTEIKSLEGMPEVYGDIIILRLWNTKISNMEGLYPAQYYKIDIGFNSSLISLKGIETSTTHYLACMGCHNIENLKYLVMPYENSINPINSINVMDSGINTFKYIPNNLHSLLANSSKIDSLEHLPIVKNTLHFGGLDRNVFNYRTISKYIKENLPNYPRECRVFPGEGHEFRISHIYFYE